MRRLGLPDAQARESIPISVEALDAERFEDVADLVVDLVLLFAEERDAHYACLERVAGYLGRLPCGVGERVALGSLCEEKALMLAARCDGVPESEGGFV